VGAPVSTLWFDSDQGGLFLKFQDPNSTAYIQVNAAGMPEAPVNGLPFARKDAAWFDLTASFTAKADKSYVDTTFATYAWTNANFLPIAGGTVTGALTVNGAFAVGGNTWLGGNCVVDGIGSAYALQSNPTAAGAGGGIIGFGSTGSIYAISGYGGYGLYTSGPHSFGGDVNQSGAYVATGLITSNLAGSDVQTSTANTVCTTNGTFRRTTSSVRYKTAIEPLQDPWADKVLELEPIYYTPQNTSDPAGFTRYGFSAEQAYATDPRFSMCEEKTLTGYEKVKEQAPNPAWGDWQRNKEGEEPPVTLEVERQGAPIYEDKLDIVHIDLPGIVAALQQVVKRQNERIAALEAALAV
jgi:hypothetical protein